MEDETKPMTITDASADITRTFRDAPPAHYTLKIENFSLFSNAKVDNFLSGDFEVHGYKWRLTLYPNGNKKSGGRNEYLALYLTLSASNVLPLDKEVYVNFKLFVYNHIKDKFLIIQDANETVRRFHGMKTEIGFDQLLPLKTFNDASNGYLVDDCCIFGVELFVLKHTGKGECLSMIKQPSTTTFTWTIQDFAALDQESCRSQVFPAGRHNWTLVVFPVGDSTEKGKSLSLYLALEDYESLSFGRNIYAEFTLRVRDQLSGNHLEKEAHCHFSTSVKDWGHLNFLTLEDLNNQSKGFLANDTLVVQVQIHVITVSKLL